MAFDLAAIRTEVFSGPYAYLNDSGTQATRVDYWINQAYHELCDVADWPFLEATSSGASPLTISDLGSVVNVVGPDYLTLNPIGYDDVTRVAGGALSTSGSAVYYYITGGTVINAYPVPSGSLSVRYIKKPTDLSTATDVPLVPAEYRDIIAIGALRRAALDNQSWQAADGYQREWQKRVDGMLGAELPAPRRQQIVYGSEDY